MKRAILAVVAMFVATGAIAAPLGLNDARRFVETIKAYEAASGTNVDRSTFDAFFARELRAVIERDGAGGEVGYLNADPFCDCQDNGGMTMRIVSLSTRGPRGVAVLENRFPDGEVRRVSLRLIVENNRWVVADVASAGTPSLLGALRQHR